MATFRAYEPSQSLEKQPPKACEECHLRKVRCIPSENGQACQQCLKHGIECRQRSRKRRRVQQSDGEGPTPAATVMQYDQSASTPRRPNSSREPADSGRQKAPPLLFAGQGGQTSSSSSPVTLHTVDRFHNTSYISRTAIMGQDFNDIDHSNGGSTTREHTLSATDLEVLHLHKAFDLPDTPERQSLIEAFFEKCWTYMPVVEQCALADPSENGEASYLVLQAVLLAGSLMRPNRYSTSSTEAQYKRVKALIQSGYERNPLHVLAGLCIIQWYTVVAPKDISLDSPRFWTTMAIGIAQQMGLHRKSLSPLPDESLRRRIWWTLYARDNLSASAHGRPRHINKLDCTQPPLNTSDFDNPDDRQARFFVLYVSILEILGDLCQLMARNGNATADEKNDIATHLLKYLDSLPTEFRLVDANGVSAPFDLHVAQLHVPILATILILYRPRSMFLLSTANAASVAAANLTFRIFEAIELREQTHCLSSAFSWHLLVASIPLLSCLRISELKESAGPALDSLEKVLSTLGKSRPSATNNLRSVRAMRRAMTSNVGAIRPDDGPNEVTELLSDVNYLAMAPALLKIYGNEAVRHYEQLVGQLGPQPGPANEHNQVNMSTQQQQDFLESLGIGDSDDLFNFDELFGLGHSWMMRDWMDDLQMSNDT